MKVTSGDPDYDNFSIDVYDSVCRLVAYGDWDLNASEPINRTAYMRDGAAVKTNGIHRFEVKGYTDVTYTVTVIQ